MDIYLGDKKPKFSKHPTNIHPRTIYVTTDTDYVYSYTHTVCKCRTQFQIHPGINIWIIKKFCNFSAYSLICSPAFPSPSLIQATTYYMYIVGTVMLRYTFNVPNWELRAYKDVEVVWINTRQKNTWRWFDLALLHFQWIN